jgi:hypothetical protein
MCARLSLQVLFDQARGCNRGGDGRRNGIAINFQRGCNPAPPAFAYSLSQRTFLQWNKKSKASAWGSLTLSFSFEWLELGKGAQNFERLRVSDGNNRVNAKEKGKP